MTRLFTDPEMSLDPNASPLFAEPSSGLGMGSDGQAAAPAPAAAAPADVGIGVAPPQAPAAASPRQAEFDRLSMGEKIALGMQEVGAAASGKPSVVDQRVKQTQESRLLQQQEFMQRTQAMEHGVKMAQGMQGEARQQFIEQHANAMDQVYPGVGAAFKTIAKMPDVGQRFMKYAAQSPTLKWALDADPSGGTLLKMMQDPKHMEKINSEIDLATINDPNVASPFSKIRNIMGTMPQLLPPKMYENLNKDGWTESEFREANDFIAKHPNPDMQKMALTPEQMTLVSKYGDDVFPKLKILPASSEKKVAEKHLEREPALRPGMIKEFSAGDKNVEQRIYDPEGTYAPGVEHDANGWAVVGRGTKAGGTTVNLPKVESSARTGANEDFQKHVYRPTLDAAKIAKTVNAQLNAISNLDISGKTGWATEMKAKGANVLVGMGLAPEKAKEFAADAQIFNKVLNEQTWALLMQQKGVQTEGDATRAKDTFARLENTPKANKFMNDFARSINNLRMKEADFYTDNYDRALESSDLSKLERDWYKKAPSVWEDPLMKKWAKLSAPEKGAPKEGASNVDALLKKYGPK